MRAKPYGAQRRCGLAKNDGTVCRVVLGEGAHVCRYHARTEEGRRVAKERRMAAAAAQEAIEIQQAEESAFLYHAQYYGLDHPHTRSAFNAWKAGLR